MKRLTVEEVFNQDTGRVRRYGADVEDAKMRRMNELVDEIHKLIPIGTTFVMALMNPINESICVVSGKETGIDYVEAAAKALTDSVEAYRADTSN
jgi:hypothetical protein